MDLANAVIKACEANESNFKFLYDTNLPIKVLQPVPDNEILSESDAAFATIPLSSHVH